MIFWTQKWNGILCSWIERINSFQMSILTQTIYGFNVVSSKIPMAEKGLPEPGLRSGYQTGNPGLSPFRFSHNCYIHLIPKTTSSVSLIKPLLSILHWNGHGYTFNTISYTTEIQNWSLPWSLILSNTSSTVAPKFYFWNWNLIKALPLEVCLISVKETPSLR